MSSNNTSSSAVGNLAPDPRIYTASERDRLARGKRVIPSASVNAFYTAVTELGGVVVGEYVNSRTRVAAICANGHPCAPIPNSVQQGGGICRTCAGCLDSVAAEGAFRRAVTALGGVVIGEYVSADVQVEIMCAAGHTCTPRPASVRQGKGLCRVCGGRSPVTAEASFRRAVSGLGGSVVGRYVNSFTPVAVVCTANHLCTPLPANVLRGRGICRVCSGKAWNVFYLTVNDSCNHLKFGITSGDPRPRLSDHRRAGFTRVVRLSTDLPGTTAPDMERAALLALKQAGELPVQGREYFRGESLQRVLDIVDYGRD